MTPSVFPCSPTPTVVCHAPVRIAADSREMWRASERINPHVSSIGGVASVLVPHTTTPRAAAAWTSIAAFRRPVVTRSFSEGRRAMSVAGNGVRSRIATITLKLRRRSATSSSLPIRSCNGCTDAPAPSADQSAIDSATLW